MYNYELTTPHGDLTVIFNDESILAIYAGEEHSSERTKLLYMNSEERMSHPIAQKTVRELWEYFDGSRREFNLPYSADYSDFQKRIFDEVVNIPFGETVSVEQLGEKIGTEDLRGILEVVQGNCIPYIIPCHRVTAGNFKDSYVGAGGIDGKHRLIEMEEYMKQKNDY